MSDVKVLFSGRGHDQDLKTTQKKLLKCIVRKPFSLFTSYIHRIKGKENLLYLRPFFNKSSREYLSDLTIRVVKEKDVKTRGIDAPTLMHKVCFKTDNAYLTSAFSCEISKLGHILRSGPYPKQVIAIWQSPLTHPWVRDENWACLLHSKQES